MVAFWLAIVGVGEVGHWQGYVKITVSLTIKEYLFKEVYCRGKRRLCCPLLYHPMTACSILWWISTLWTSTSTFRRGSSSWTFSALAQVKMRPCCRLHFLVLDCQLVILIFFALVLQASWSKAKNRRN